MGEPTPRAKKTFKETVESVVRASFGLVMLVGAFWAIGSGIEDYQKFPVGAHVFTSREVYGMSDLDRAYDDLTKAREAKDEYGLAELAEKERAILFPKDTFGLVIEGKLKGTTMYRKVRILGWPLTGKAFWVRRDALVAAALKTQDDQK